MIDNLCYGQFNPYEYNFTRNKILRFDLLNIIFLFIQIKRISNLNHFLYF